MLITVCGLLTAYPDGSIFQPTVGAVLEGGATWYVSPEPFSLFSSYDANGNRQTKNATTYSYDAADQMTASGGVMYGYDANGNQTGRGSDVLFYDHENRLTKVNIGGVERDPCYDLTGDEAVTSADMSAISARLGTSEGNPNYDDFYDIAPPPNGDGSITGADLSLVSAQIGFSCTTSRFTYNGDGLRTARVSSRYSDMRYVWDMAAGLPVMLKEQDLHNTLDGHGTDNTYVYGLDLISMSDRTGAQTYFVSDGLGSTANLTDGSGNTTASYSYDVFGAIRSETGTGAAAANEWRFTGEQRDPQGGRNFYYLRARYYDPGIGRFLSRDPLPAGNLYAYVGNNPGNLVDPLGLCGWTDPWNCGDELVGAGQDALDAVVENLSDIATVVAYVDAVTGPLTGVWFEVASAVLTEVAILIGDCDWGTKAGLTLLNLENLGIGLIGHAALVATPVVTFVAGPVAGGAYAVTVYITVAAAEIGLTTGSLYITENEPSCKE